MDDEPYVLLIEDDAPTRRLVRDILEGELGVAVLEATEGTKALNVLAGATRAPGLLVVDLMLPNMDGETFMANVRRLYGPDLPIVVMSAMDPKLVRTSAEYVGARGVVLKPFNVADLMAEVTDALRLSGWSPNPAPIIDFDTVRRLRAARSSAG